MVRLLNLYAANFKKLKFDKPLELPEGVTLIAGLNEAGKSSILDAILYALYARVVRPPPEKGKTRNEDIIAYGASEAKVVLEFAIGDKKFKVQRIIRRSGRPRAYLDEILNDGTTKPLAVGQEEVTKQIERLLGDITFNEMVSSTVVAQKELDKLIELRKEDRKKIINVFLNLESFNTVLESLDEKRKTLEGTKERAGQVQIERNKLETLRHELEEFERKKERRSELLRENGELESKLQRLENEYSNLNTLYRLLREYGEALQTRENLKLEIERMRDRFQTDNGRRKELVTTLESIKNQLQEHSDLERVEDTLSEIRNLVDMLRTLDAKEAEVESALQRADQKVKELAIGIPQEVDRAELGKRLREGRRSLWPLFIGSLLSMFGAIASLLLNSPATAIPSVLIATVLLVLIGFRALKISSLTRLQELYTRMESFDRAVEDRGLLLQKQAEISRERVQTEEYLSTLCTRIPRYVNIFYESKGKGILQAVEAIMQKVKSDLQHLNSLKTKFATIQEELSKLPTQEELKNIDKKIKALEKRLEEILLPPLPENVVYSKELEEKISKRKEELAQEIEGCRTRISINNNQAAELEEWLNMHGDVWKRFKQQEESVAKLEKELRIVKKALEGIQATAEALRNRVKPNAEAYMSIILPVLTNGRYKAAIIDENYNVQVWDPDAGQYRVKEVFSGGTEDQFLLTLRLAFALSLIPEVKGQKPEFIFLDEPLGSSDEVRRSGIIEYLNTDLSKKFRQIFIISHVGGLEEQVKNIIYLQDGRLVEGPT